MKLALIADWLPTYGGAEHVVAALTTLWPESPLYTTVVSRSTLPVSLADADIRPDRLLQMLYRLIGRHQVLLPLMPQAMERIDLDGFDIVLSSSHAVGKGVVPPSTSVHICYCHTPMRYAWEMEEEYLNDFRLRGYLRKKVKAELKRLRRWDLSTAKRVDSFIANSSETQKRIQRIYGRESVVIPPPVDARFFDFPLPKDEGAYFLGIGRLVPYKKFDLLIELANRLKFRLKIAGQGSEEARLKAMAGPTVEFLGYVSEEELPALYTRASALLFPQVEDAGIVPMEAQACGTPVIAYGKGGVLDVIVEGTTGLLTSVQTTDAFADALKHFAEKQWDHDRIRSHARKFHIDEFKTKIMQKVEEAYHKFGV